MESDTSGRKHNLRRAAYWLTLATAMAPLVSIAVSNILLVAALLVTLAAYHRLEMPPWLTLPLLLFAAATIVAVALSPDPWAGWPQVKQLYVFSTLALIFTVLRRQAGVERLLIAWTILAAASAVWSFVQFWIKRQYALDHGYEFYRFYVGRRATGFMSHWMTFGAEQMIVLLVLVSALLFAAIRTHRAVFWAAAVTIGVSIGIGFTRSVWLGTAIGAIYLVAASRPKLLPLVPLVAVVGWFTSPRSIRERAMSVYQPHGTVDSNEHRHITRQAGIQMIKSSPWVGIGPNMVQRDFQKYLPEDIARPLPEGFYGHLHNLYLQYAAERGVPALLAFLWFVGAALLYLLRRAFRVPGSRGITHAAVAVIIAVLIEAFFEVNLGDSEVLRMFLAVIACAYAVNLPERVDA